jgi:hypothetical protein
MIRVAFILEARMIEVGLRSGEQRVGSGGSGWF